MTTLVLDVETTTFEKGNPFAQRNKLMYVGAYREGSIIRAGTLDLLPYVQHEIISASRLVGFNLKFDLHWLRRYGIVIPSNSRVWDLQLAHFLLRGQKTIYPSLNDTLEFYGFPPKDPTIERDYWSKGIDTPDIPPELMLKYLTRDLEATMEVYQAQQDEFKQLPQLYKLFQLQCDDLLVLEEMEWNGLWFDQITAQSKAEELLDEIKNIEQELNGYISNVSLNWNSTDHLSLFLYGGILKLERREVVGVYKTGAKVGEPRYRIIEDEFPLPRLFEPIPRSELKKEGYYSTDESILRQLKGRKAVIDLLLRRSELTKLSETLVGLSNIVRKKDWPDGELHGQFNQCVAQTGRLSASQPNQQNWD
ncbi:MAG: DNA polymerase, partial [Candidatus Berkelbacteria bacterium]|nr:DNA polymerase [Candidatus Berkelbacteria bacterium]